MSIAEFKAMLRGATLNAEVESLWRAAFEQWKKDAA